MDIGLLISSFIAGLLTFLAPCTLPLVPGYLSFISGSSSSRRKIFLNGVFFMLGFSVVFIVFGSLAGFIGGTLLSPYRFWLTRIGGAFIVFFGLFMLNVINIPLFRKEFQFRTPAIFERGKAFSSLILGAAFALGWTPCVGPILGSILLLASTSTSAFQGAFLLGIFSLGLAVPFLMIAAAVGSASDYINRIGPLLKFITFFGGIFLIILGALMLTDKMSIFISYIYQIFDFIHYERILDYL